MFAANVDPAGLAPEELRLRRRVVTNLGALVRKMHHEGVYQYDFNPCNFLVDPKTGELTVIDFAKVKLYKHMPEDKALENLAKFARRRDRIPMTDVFRFLRGYVGAGREKKDERFGLFRVAEQLNREIVSRDLRAAAERCMNRNRKFAVTGRGERHGIFLKSGNKFGKFDDALMDKFIDVAMAAGARKNGITKATLEHFGRRLHAQIRYGRVEAMEAEWQRLNMLRHAGLTGDVPLALIYFGDGTAYCFVEPAHKEIPLRADRAMALMGLLNEKASASADRVLLARATFLYGLRGLRFAAPPSGADVGADWFAVRHKLRERLLHLGVRFGGRGAKRFFRLEIAVGETGSNYGDIAAGKRALRDGALPLSEVVIAAEYLGGLRQRFRNVWHFPAGWNIAAMDTFYYTTDAELPGLILRAAALVRERLPLVLESAARRA